MSDLSESWFSIIAIRVVGFDCFIDQTCLGFHGSTKVTVAVVDQNCRQGLSASCDASYSEETFSSKVSEGSSVCD